MLTQSLLLRDRVNDDDWVGSLQGLSTHDSLFAILQFGCHTIIVAVDGPKTFQPFSELG